jgi:hypothetical protein
LLRRAFRRRRDDGWLLAAPQTAACNALRMPQYLFPHHAKLLRAPSKSYPRTAQKSPFHALKRTFHALKRRFLRATNTISSRSYPQNNRTSSLSRPHIFPKSTAHLPKVDRTSPSNRPNISASASARLLSARIEPRKASPEYPKAVSERQRKSHISPQSGIARTRVFSYLCTNTLCAHVAELGRACLPARSISHK